MAKPHSQGLFLPFFMTYSSIYLFLQIRISEITLFSCWDPCVHRESNEMAPIARKDVSIQECFHLNCSRVKLKYMFFIKFSGTSPSDHYYNYLQDVLSALGFAKNKKIVFSKI